ncbi:4963_t:CDS:1 [Scutellospora calospora]|uniref:4963_t:CDS:1 n=1 Tax=Scutellospora calospora TaxID=85575 RepID=A0ACA9L634_9GLOM|nr:4963_t:CDS:1 [Scutellospora calospora]
MAFSNNVKESILIPGSLPIEILDHVFSYLCHDTKFLHSCLLVNRIWCQHVVGLLWRAPFSIWLEEYKSISLINTYISCMNDEEKSWLKKNGINVSTDTTNPLFNYSSYLKVFDNCGLDMSVKTWFIHSKCISKEKDCLIIDADRRIILSEILYKLFFRQNLEFTQLTFLRKPSIFDIPSPFIFTLHPSLISQLRVLRLNFAYTTESGRFKNLVNLVAILPNLCKKLRELDICLQIIDVNLVADFIQSQENLQDFRLECYSGNIAPAISALQFQSDSLVRVEFSQIQFSGIALDALVLCKNLRILCLIRCKGLTSFTWLPLKKAEFKLQTLYVRECETTQEFLESAIETANYHLNELFMSYSSPKIIESIMKFCPSIKTFEVDIKPSSTNKFLILLTKLVLLERLSVSLLIYDASDFLTTLPNFLPTSLFDLKLEFQNTPRNLVSFLKKCRAPIQILTVFSILGVDNELVGFITKFAKESDTLRKVLINDWSGRKLVFHKYSEVWTTCSLKPRDRINNIRNYQYI